MGNGKQKEFSEEKMMEISNFLICVIEGLKTN
jgi:hypothetical protein